MSAGLPFELTIARDPDDVHVWELATFGRVRLPRTPRGEVVISAPDLADWTVSRGRQRHTWQAFEDGRGVVATVDDRARRVVFGAREWVVTTAPARLFQRPGPWIVCEGGRELVTFARREWGRRPPNVTISNEAAIRSEPRLTLLAAWTANRLSVSNIR